MNTAKKRILSLTLTICLALSMMLTLSACGKKNLEEYFNTDTMQKLVTSSVEQYESQGMELKMYAEGDELHYDLTLTTIETTDDDRSVYAEALEAGLAETAQTFVDAAKDVQKSVDIEQAQKLAQKIKTGERFDLNDFKAQISQMKSIGVSGLIDKLLSLIHI